MHISHTHARTHARTHTIDLTSHNTTSRANSHVKLTYQDSVIVHDGIETMGNGQDSAIEKLFPQSSLNDTICPE